MFEWNEDEKKIDFSHNPFSMPHGDMVALETEGAARDQGLPIRHRLQRHRAFFRRDPQPSPRHHEKAFAFAGYGEEVVIEKFGGMYRAFQYGAPPHGGIAPGVDRIVMLLAGEENLREVVLFPMNQAPKTC